MTPTISQESDDLIVACEVSSKAYYEKKLRKPEWPGASSGVTVGIGYDLGYASDAKIKSDWGDRLPGTAVDAMLRCPGVTGAAAHALLPKVRSLIDVPWNDAIYVYEHVDIPEWTARVCRAIPGAESLPPDCLGALTSLAYNRGLSFQSPQDRYREMRAIRAHIIAQDLDKVAAEFRAMKRLWPTVRGLQIRRDKEADLWEAGLRAPATAPMPKAKPSEAPKPLAEPATSKTGESVTGVGGAGATIAGANAATSSGLSPYLVAAIVVFGLVITVAVIAYINHRKSQPLLARAKG